MVLVDQKGASSEELLARIAKHDRYFSRMINLIPRDLYLHTHSSSFSAEGSSSSKVDAAAPAVSSGSKKRKAQEAAEENHAVNEKYYKHRKQPLTPDERKLRSLQNKKAKYSSENAKVDAGGDYDDEGSEPEEDSVDSDEDEEEDEEEEEEDYGDDEEDESEAEEQEKPANHRKEKEASSKPAKAGGSSSRTHEAPASAHPSPIPSSSPSNVKMDELRRRLQDRIASLKAQRLPTKKRPAERPAAKNPPPLKKPAPALHRGTSEDSIEEIKTQLAFQRDLPASATTASSSSSSLDLTASPDLEFGHVVAEERELRTAPIKRDGGKVQRIKKLLHEAEIKRERLRTLIASKDEVEQRKAKAEQWQDVLKTAAGEKILAVDPTATGLSKAETKLKKALKRREKKKQKSAEEWTARLDKVEEEKTARQSKKEENKQNRKAQRYGDVSTPVADKETKKKAVPIGRPGAAAATAAGGAGKAKDAKAEQKGRNRAGFEGKKVSFLNGSKN